MSANITLKNIPDDVYERLKQAATAHRRSINSEAIACLEKVLLPDKDSIAERLARAREIRSGFEPGKFKVADIARAIDQGRP